MPQLQPLVFSHKLRRVWIDLALRRTAVDSIQATLVSFSELPVLTSLSVLLPSFASALSFAPLLDAVSLRHLWIQANGKAQPTSGHIDQLRSLSHVRTMAVAPLNAEALESLLRTPHQLQWQEISSIHHMDSTTAASLSCLPTLTTLQAHICNTVSFLHSLPVLGTLDLEVTWDAIRAAVVAGLACCPQLSSLCLRAQVTSAHMRTILDALPLLTSLTLDHCDRLESLSFFGSVDWSQRAGALAQLTIQDSSSTWLGRYSGSRLPVVSASALSCLRSLTSLTLKHAFVAPLDSSTVRRMRPPSAEFPLLTHFSQS